MVSQDKVFLKGMNVRHTAFVYKKQVSQMVTPALFLELQYQLMMEENILVFLVLQKLWQKTFLKLSFVGSEYII